MRVLIESDGRKEEQKNRGGLGARGEEGSLLTDVGEGEVVGLLFEGGDVGVMDGLLKAVVVVLRSVGGVEVDVATVVLGNVSTID